MADQMTNKTAEAESKACEKKEFPYTSIFGSDGLLSELQQFEGQTENQQALADNALHLKPVSTQIVDEIMEEPNDLPCQKRELPPPNEALFEIDHILERVFSCLSPRQLLKCRLVSHRWRIFAQVPLQNQLHFKFFDQILRPPIKLKSKAKGRAYNSSFHIPNSSTKTLRDFNKFLMLSQIKNTCFSIPFIFPGTKFVFGETLLRDPQLQKFLSLHGVHINELTLLPNDGPRGFYFGDRRNSNLAHEWDLMMQMKTLLLQQTPNLSVLKVGNYSDIERQHRSNCSIDDLKDLPVDSELLVNSHLKTLHILGVVLSPKLFQLICELCPTLEEITFDSCNFERLINPVNRIHLLKTLSFNIKRTYYREDFKTYENLASAIDLDKENLQLYTLRIHMYEDLDIFDFADDPEEENRVVNVLNKILGSSWKSLGKIKWDGATFLNGVKWPSIMPNVTQLELYNPVSPNPRGNHTIFPEGCGNLKEMFPKLRFLKFAKKVEEYNYDYDFVYIEDLFTWLNIVEPLPGIQSVFFEGFVTNIGNDAQSVRYEDICLMKPRPGDSKLPVQFLSNIFPKAQLRLSSQYLL